MPLTTESTLISQSDFTLPISQNNQASFISLTTAETTLETLESPEFLKKWFHPKEQSLAATYRYPKKRLSYLLGRYCAKSSIVSYLSKTNTSPIEPNTFWISNGVLGHPIISTQQAINPPILSTIHISIAHTQATGCCIAFDHHQLYGIDIEPIHTRSAPAIANHLSTQDHHLLSQALPSNHTLQMVWAWTARESLGKALKTGLAVPDSLFEIKDGQIDASIMTLRFKHLPQFKTVSFLKNDYLITIALPAQTDISLSEIKSDLIKS